MNAKEKTVALLLTSLILVGTSIAQADEQSAIAAVESYEGQVLGIAKDVEGVRILIPAKTFEGRMLADEDLKVLSEIPKIVELDLKNAGIGDAGLAHLAGLTDLQRLHLEKTKVTDAGLQHLKGLSSLVYLNLYGTEVTDAGLEHLKPLKQLKNLYLWQTKVSEEAAKAFQAAMEVAGNESLEINLGWEKELLSKARLAALKEQRLALEASEAEGATEVTLVEDPDFKTHIMPIFAERCVDCHGEEKQKAKLRLDSYEAVMKGTPDGPVVIAGDLIGSHLFQVITLPPGDDDLMPPKGDPLTEIQVGLIRNWINKGAKPEAEVVVATTEKPSENKESGVFHEYVLPILMDRCADCHGEDKQKAKLRLDSLAATLKGAGDEAIVVPGKPEESSLYTRIVLPADHDDRMPPKGDVLTKAQTDLIKLWIASGAE
jgi:mono/diheme cytochrome c family protein